MNYYGPRQRETNGRWDYTNRNDDRIYPVGYCAGWREHSPDVLGEAVAARLNADIEPFRDKYHKDGHPTADDACACYRDYLLDQHLRLVRWDHTVNGELLRPGTLELCHADGCTEYTAHHATISKVLERWPLCDEHLSREEVEKLFGSIGSRIAS